MHRILFVHPDPKLVSLYGPHLTRYFSLDSAYDGLTAVRLAKLNKPSIIVSEYDLPMLSGLSFLKFIRSHRDFSHVPFLFFSATADAESGLSLGANELIDRRSSPEELIERIYHHLKINQPIINLYK